MRKLRMEIRVYYDIENLTSAEMTLLIRGLKKLGDDGAHLTERLEEMREKRKHWMAGELSPPGESAT